MGMLLARHRDAEVKAPEKAPAPKATPKPKTGEK